MNPCPFCGYKDELTVRSSDAGWYVYCRSCVALGPHRQFVQDAVDDWNSRQEVEQIEGGVHDHD